MKSAVFFAIFRKAFISSLPVLMGYSTMGFAAGVLLSAKAGITLPAVWGALTSFVTVSGALQFMMVDWIRSATPMRDVALLTLCLNIRYGMYGLSLLERFKGLPFWKKFYLIWGLTDETYALEVECKFPLHSPESTLYCMLLTLLDHSYWILGVTFGALAGTSLPFSNKGIDFAMTALFLVILTDQCREKINRLPAVIGGGVSVLAFLIFGASSMLIPSMILMLSAFLIFRKRIEAYQKKEEAR